MRPTSLRCKLRPTFHRLPQSNALFFGADLGSIWAQSVCSLDTSAGGSGHLCVKVLEGSLDAARCHVRPIHRTTPRRLDPQRSPEIFQISRDLSEIFPSENVSVCFADRCFWNLAQRQLFCGFQGFKWDTAAPAALLGSVGGSLVIPRHNSNSRNASDRMLVA